MNKEELFKLEKGDRVTGIKVGGTYEFVKIHQSQTHKDKETYIILDEIPRCAIPWIPILMENFLRDFKNETF